MKIAILGTGRVGSACAFALVMRRLGTELVLVGRDRRRVEGDAMDLQHAAALVGRATVRAATLDDAGGVDDADVIVLTNSAGGKTTVDRLDELRANADLFRGLVPQLARRAPRAIYIVVTNPVDAMTYLTIRFGDLPSGRVVGTGTLLDTIRFRATLSEAWRINPNDVRAYILGEHGESQFAALSVATAGGVRIEGSDAFVRQAAEDAKHAGPAVHSRKGFTNYGVAGSVATIVSAIREDSRAVLPLSTRIDGYLGVRDVCLSVPCVVGRDGVERTLPVDLDDAEASAFRRSAGVLREALASVGA